MFTDDSFEKKGLMAETFDTVSDIVNVRKLKNGDLEVELALTNGRNQTIVIESEMIESYIPILGGYGAEEFRASENYYDREYRGFTIHKEGDSQQAFYYLINGENYMQLYYDKRYGDDWERKAYPYSFIDSERYWDKNNYEKRFATLNDAISWFEMQLQGGRNFGKWRLEAKEFGADYKRKYQKINVDDDLRKKVNILKELNERIQKAINDNSFTTMEREELRKANNNVSMCMDMVSGGYFEAESSGLTRLPSDEPNFDPQKADRNKDGKISSWERTVGNKVAKGIREGRKTSSKGIDTFAEPFEDIGISKPYARLGVIAAGITALAFGVKKLRK